MPVDMTGRTVIVTGAARGIGRACAARFARAGAHVAMLDLARETGEAAAAEIAAEGPGEARFHEVDVGDKVAVETAVAAIDSERGGIHVLVNNAALTHDAHFLDLEEADFDRVFQVNLKGAMFCGQAAARRMIERGIAGAVVNMSSINAVVAIPNQVPYVVAKGGLNQLTRIMALGLAEHGIRVNGIGPGSILTEMLRDVVLSDEAARRKILSRTPLGRAGEPEEIANIALFLASDEASYMTGETVYADGGRLALNYTVPVPES